MGLNSVGICNLALGYLGGNTIMSLDDDSVEANLCNANYDTCRDAVLEDLDWTFATERFKMSTPMAEKPLYEYSSQFLLPDHIIRVIDVNQDDRPWCVEGRKILCLDASINVRAIVKVTETNLFTNAFVQCLAPYLAANIAIPLTQSPQLMEGMLALYNQKKMLAGASDTKQGTTKSFRSKWTQQARLRSGYGNTFPPTV